MKKLRLLVTTKCNKKCNGCYNKDWDLSSLPLLTTFKEFYEYDEILITGGEPTLLRSLDLLDLIKKIEDNTIVLSKPKLPSVYIYSNCFNPYKLFWLTQCDLDVLQGFTITLHTQKDVDNFNILNNLFLQFGIKDYYYSLRLNIFKGVKIPKYIDLSLWKIKNNMEWVKNCPLPKDEEFKQLILL